MRKTSLVLLGVVMGASVASIGARVPFSSPWAPSGAHAASSDVYRSLNLFGDVFEKVRADYVEKPDDKKMVEAAVSGMLASLDPHSSYMDAKSFQDMQIQTQGKFGGLGIEVMQEDGLVKVVAPIDDTPAARAGILSGDFITAIDGEAVQGMTLNQAVDKMRGEVNTNVKLTLARGPKKDKVEVTLTRAVIQIKSVRSRVEQPDVGYIRITQFTEQTYEGLKDAMQKVQKDIPADKFKGYIIDLRNNPGGLLDQSVAVVNAFIDHGEIVSTRGRNADETQRYNARPIDLSKGKPVVVLINGGSASASEIVAGALQDHKRATLIGTRSFGKGSVQTIIPLGLNNGALRLTTARYYTPSGRSIQAKGIEPDVMVLEDVPDELKGKDKTEGEASLKGHLKNGENEEHGSQAYVPPDAAKDKALHAALDLLRGVKTADALKAESAKAMADAAKPESKSGEAKSEAKSGEAKAVDKPAVGRPTEAPSAAPPVGPNGEPVLKQGPTPAPVPEK
ncbi:carboxyl-terminal processing protease [Rhodoblastus acidophilus]|uniref:Carboxyl-terminal processing protease n=1 Tax=Rhodoblastus acidophilus TaxID=1074 RepID=A0A212QZX8_RHOAC|nr:S41 family peptidase [Rhodoblastus acidophilus]MCW2315679.1 carboxyl-terminal processing protease [Rhodoblastus acidophilus]SNB65281.1 carboxyl-terminal processing protease [Rhodoblastus acidophilus]